MEMYCRPSWSEWGHLGNSLARLLQYRWGTVILLLTAGKCKCKCKCDVMGVKARDLSVYGFKTSTTTTQRRFLPCLMEMWNVTLIICYSAGLLSLLSIMNMQAFRSAPLRDILHHFIILCSIGILATHTQKRWRKWRSHLPPLYLWG